MNSLTSSPSMYGKSCDLARYCATELLPHPAGPVTMNRCLCTGCTGREIDFPIVAAGRVGEDKDVGTDRTEA